MANLNPTHSTSEHKGRVYHHLDTDDMEDVLKIEDRGDFILLGWSYE